MVGADKTTELWRPPMYSILMWRHLGSTQRTLGQLSNGMIFPHIIFQKTHKMIVEDPKTDKSVMLQQYTTPHALFVACEVLDCLQSWKVILKESWDHGGGQMVHA